MKIYVAKEYIKYEGDRMVSVNESLKELKKSLDSHILEIGGLAGELSIEIWEGGKCISSEEYEAPEIKKQAYLEYMEWCEEYDRKFD